MPIIGYKCKACENDFDEIMKHPVPDEVPCPKCGGASYKQLSTMGHYSIKGNNSASITPKKYRGEN